MNRSILTLWVAYPDDLSSEIARRCEAILSEDERTRMRAFRFARDQQAFLASHALVRNALSHSVPLAPAEWRFRADAYGKPQIAPEFGLRFNLSHSSKLVACLVSHGIEVGVDLEPQDRAGEIVEIAPRILSPFELAEFALLTDEEKPNRALSLWTLKEAFTKACGIGLSLPLPKISFLFEGDDIRLEVDPDLGFDAERWQFSPLEHFGHRIAVVTEHMVNACLQLCEVRPAVAEPRVLSAAIGRWYSGATAKQSI